MTVYRQVHSFTPLLALVPSSPHLLLVLRSRRLRTREARPSTLSSRRLLRSRAALTRLLEPSEAAPPLPQAADLDLGPVVPLVALSPG